MKSATCGGCRISLWILVIGGLNWLLVGAFDWNLVNSIFGVLPLVERLVYIVVGLSAIMTLGSMYNMCKHCKMNSKKK